MIPWQELRDLDAVQVAERIGLERARKSGQHKWECPRCSSSDALHVYPDNGQHEGRGAFCFSCQEPLSTIDLVMEAWSVDAKEAAGLLGSMFGVTWEDRSSAPPIINRKPKARLGEIPVDRAMLRAPVEEMFMGSRLGPMAQAFLASRGLDVEMCAYVGLRSIESQEEYLKVIEGFHRDELEAGGMLTTKGRHHPGWALPVLAIPYLTRARVMHPEHGEIPALDTMRFRQIRHERGPKYLSLAGPLGTPATPFLVEQVDVALANDMPLYICEGELNALSCLQAGFPAISGCGSGSWRREWCRGLQDVRAGGRGV
jgi:DNA primase